MSYFVNNLLYDPCIHAEQPAYMMAANAGVIKAIVSFYRFKFGYGIRKTQKPYFDK